jgi:hypothetical protein
MTAGSSRTRQGLDRWIAIALFLVVTSVTLAASRQQGVHRDEAVYMEAGERYVAYLERLVRGQAPRPFSAATVDPYFSCGAACNSEHPPLMKLLFGLSWRVFADVDPGKQALHPGGFARPSGTQRSFALLDESTAFRLPTVLIFGLLTALVYLFFVDALAHRKDTDTAVPTAAGRVGALAAALLTAAQPRAFFHAQTAAFDLPAAFFWFACMAAYWRALRSERPLRATLWLGVLYGLFLATKLQSFFLPFALGAHWLWLRFRHWRVQKRAEAGDSVARLAAPPAPPGPWPLVALVVVSPLVFFAMWPYLWHATFAHFKTYWAFHANHVHYNFEYLGVNYNHPPFPWHEPFGMLITTAPVVLLVLGAAGMGLLTGDAWRARTGAPLAEPRSTRMLLLICAAVPILPFLTGQAPIFGETKHWLGTMPILALAAGYAVQALARALEHEYQLATRRTAQALVFAGLVVVAAAPAVAETVRSHPYGLSHYNALAGGAPGGADLGMNRQFWGYSVRGLLDWFNARLATGSIIYPHDWSEGAFNIDLRDHLLREDLRYSQRELPGMRCSNVALVVHELHFNKYDYMIWNTYGHAQPTRVLTLDGVPLVSVYERRGPLPAGCGR